MTLDLLNHSTRFSDLDIFVENKFPIEDESLQTNYGFIPKRSAFFNIPWHDQMVYFMRKEEFSQAPQLKEKYQGLFLLSFEDIPPDLSPYIYHLEEETTEVFEVLDVIKAIIRERKKVHLLEESQNRCSQLFKEATQYIAELRKSEEKTASPMNEITKIFLSLDNNLLQEPRLETFIKKASAHYQDLNLWEDLCLAQLDEIIEKRMEDASWQLFPLDWLGLPHFLTYRLTTNNIKEASFALSLLLEWLEKYAAFNPQHTMGDENHTLWEQALTEAPLPMAMINVRGDLIVYNQRFTRLNLPPRDCLVMEDEEALEIQGEFYKVKKIEIDRPDGMSHLYLFINQDQLRSQSPEAHNLKSISSEELGIISSSIAHELNNPLAGILAAIGLLELEDWEEDEKDALTDMKASAKRCKTLVEIFLGFSRARDHQQKQGTLREALGQALDLLRFRMIESDIRIEVDVESSSEPFKRYVNLSLASMILYLVLGEVLTLFNHHRLVLGDKNLKALKAIYKEETDRVTLSFSSEIELKEKVLSSKLIQYLVEVLGMEMEIEGQKIIFLDWKLI